MDDEGGAAGGAVADLKLRWRRVAGSPSNGAMWLACSKAQAAPATLMTSTISSAKNHGSPSASRPPITRPHSANQAVRPSSSAAAPSAIIRVSVTPARRSSSASSSTRSPIRPGRSLIHALALDSSEGRGGAAEDAGGLGAAVSDMAPPARQGACRDGRRQCANSVATGRVSGSR